MYLKPTVFGIPSSDMSVFLFSALCAAGENVAAVRQPANVRNVPFAVTAAVYGVLLSQRSLIMTPKAQLRPRQAGHASLFYPEYFDKKQTPPLDGVCCAVTAECRKAHPATQPRQP